MRHPGIEYVLAPSERSPLPGDSVDLVSAAAAVHWFDPDLFADEVRRVTRPGSLLAIWTYHVGRIEGGKAEFLTRFYEDEMKDYFPARAQIVDTFYETLSLPGTDVASPEFFITTEWNLANVLDFVSSWSGVMRYREATGEDPVPSFGERLAAVWGDASKRERFRWPIYMKATRL